MKINKFFTKNFKTILIIVLTTILTSFFITAQFLKVTKLNSWIVTFWQLDIYETDNTINISNNKIHILS